VKEGEGGRLGGQQKRQQGVTAVPEFVQSPRGAVAQEFNAAALKEVLMQQ
jgi:hypothetical protein